MQSSLAETLRILRARRDLTVTDAAKLIGVNRENLRDPGHGARKPYYPTLQKNPKTYGVTGRELMLPAAEEELAFPKAEALAAKPSWEPGAAEETRNGGTPEQREVMQEVEPILRAYRVSWRDLLNGVAQR